MQFDYIGNISDQQQSIGNKTEAFLRCIQEAAKRIRFIQKAEVKCKEIRSVLQTDDKEALWKVLQKYLRLYMEFINSLKDLTGVYIYPVDESFYISVSIEDIGNQLRMLIGFIYAKEALHSTVNTAFKQCLKNCLKESNCFSKQELKRLDLLIGS